MKKLLIGLACLGSLSAIQIFGLDQYDKTRYEANFAYVAQLIHNLRNELAQDKEQAAALRSQGVIVNEIDSANKSREWVVKAYKRLDFCLRTQRFLLRPSDEAWIYCKTESRLKDSFGNSL